MRALLVLWAIAAASSVATGAVLSQGQPGLPGPASAAGRRLSSDGGADAAPWAAAADELGATLPDRWVVVFKPSVMDARRAAARLAAQVQAAMAADVTAAAAAPVLHVLSTLGGSSSSGEAAAAAAGGGAPSGGLQGAVVNARPQALHHIRRSNLVAAVFADRVVAAQQAAACATAQALSQGVTAAPVSTFRWDGCLVNASRLVWMGQACNGTRVAYTELRAVNRSTNAVVRVQGSLCVLRPDARNTSTWQRWNEQRFGSCGTAPTVAPTLPVALCLAAASSPLPSPRPSPRPRPVPSPPPPSPVPSPPPPSPVPSPPPPSPVLSPSPPPPSPVTSPPPPSPVTSPPLPQLVLPRVPLEHGELVPSGVRTIEAVANSAVVSTLGLPLAQQVVVGVLDSGVDATHPDINYAGGSSWVTPTSSVAGDTASPDVDLYGHGTHVAGIVGARNNGAGVVGVAPGVPIYSLKVLNGAGRGSLSDILTAVKWATVSGRALGIRVINLSLATYTDPASSEYAIVFDTVCGVMSEASKAGLLVVAAAGNYASSIDGYLPANCPSVATATATDGNAPSSFSNFLSAYTATDAVKAHIIAAPGVLINSTISFSRDASGYKTLSGTSMASPHVAGVAANCFMAGACSGSGTNALAVVQAAARERYGMSAYGFKGDAMSTANFRYYGLLAWSKF